MNFEIQFPNEPQNISSYIRSGKISKNVEYFSYEHSVALRGLKNCYLGPQHITITWKKINPEKHEIIVNNRTNHTLNISKNVNSKCDFPNFTLKSKDKYTLIITGHCEEY